MNAMMTKLNDEAMEKVSGGISFDPNDMSLEDRAVFDAKHEQFLQVCCDYGRGRVDQATYFETRKSWNAYVEGMERKYG